ncbi:MAG: hypothetical protein M3Z06_15275 [Actinomycetota bacterium]|nr:hypothetical protein [Actinomycetota bacterium]
MSNIEPGSEPGRFTKRGEASMGRISKRATLLFSLGALAIPLGVAATAYACTSVATLSDSPGAVAAGSTVTVTGAFYGAHDPADATTAGPVEIRLGRVDGPVMATASPSGPDRSFSVQVTVPPSAGAGQTFLTATQENADGTPVYGTPARQTLMVSAPAAPVFGPIPAPCVVPNVTGRSASAAKSRLTAAHCAVGKITRPKTKPHKAHHVFKLVVASTGLSAGSTRASGTKVNLRLRWV